MRGQEWKQVIEWRDAIDQVRDNGDLDWGLSIGDGEKGTDSESTQEAELTGAAGGEAK